MGERRWLASIAWAMLVGLTVGFVEPELAEDKPSAPDMTEVRGADHGFNRVHLARW